MSARRASVIKDPKLAPEGQRKIAWVAQHAPVLNAVFEKYLSDGTLSGLPVAVCVPLEAKTAYLSLLLHRAGALIALAGTAPGYVQDDVAAGIAAEGVTVFSLADGSPEDFEGFLTSTLETDPVLLLDDRAELTRILLTTRQDRRGSVWGATEQTTSGVNKLRNMEREGLLTYPVIAGNDAMCKHLFDNRYGTGQSVFTAMMALT
ncbi:MAG: adenosylhomocysteinase, partial [Rubrobacteraceae bacterium]